MRTKKLLAVLAVGVSCLGAVPFAAHADPLTPTVEGDANWDVLFGGSYTDDTMAIAWSCSATVTGAVAAHSHIACELRQHGVAVDTAAIAMSGNVAVTAKVSVIPMDSFEFCWTADALLTDASTIEDTTLPNCIDNKLPL
jgi:hypothetical protein